MADDMWTARDRRYEELRDQGYGPDCAQNEVDVPGTHTERPVDCTACRRWAEKDEPDPARAKAALGVS